MSYSISKIKEKKDFSSLKDICLILSLGLFLGLFAKVFIFLYFTPVPIGLQNSISIAYGCFLKSKKAFFSVLAFIVFGALGLPFFSNGAHGIFHLLTTNGGYIIGYSIAAFFVGKTLETFKSLPLKKIAFIIFVGHLLVLFSGMCWFSSFVGLKKAFLIGVLPFIPGDIFKTIVITKLIKITNKKY